MPTRGPQAGPVQAYFAGLQPIIASMQKLQEKVENVDMTGPVRGAGKAWQENFKYEGWLAGAGWTPLSRYTRSERARRGYGAASPILQQSGGLRKVAADYPAEMKTGQKSMSRSTPGTPGSDDSTPTSLTIRMSRNRAVLTLTGSKVANNEGGTNKAFTRGGLMEYRLPRRRFWFVSPEVKGQMVESLNEVMRAAMGKLM